MKNKNNWLLSLISFILFFWTVLIVVWVLSIFIGCKSAPVINADPPAIIHDDQGTDQEAEDPPSSEFVATENHSHLLMDWEVYSYGDNQGRSRDLKPRKFISVYKKHVVIHSETPTRYEVINSYSFEHQGKRFTHLYFKDQIIFWRFEEGVVHEGFIILRVLKPGDGGAEVLLFSFLLG